MDPRNPDTLLAAASLYKSCGLLPEAARSLELALEERPGDAVIRQALGVVLTDLGMPASSILPFSPQRLTQLGLLTLMPHVALCKLTKVPAKSADWCRNAVKGGCDS